MRIALAAAALIVAAAVSQAAAQTPARPLELIDVPYIPQSEALCGGAAAAMVMRFWGATGIYAESFESLVDRDAGGIRGDDLLRALTTRGWDARSFRGDPDLVRTHLGRRRPVIALIEDRPGRFHYVVIVAWPVGNVVLHDPARAPFRVMPDAAFTRAWEAAGKWTLLALPSAPLGEVRPPTAPDAAPNRPMASPCSALVDEAVRLAGTGDADAAQRLLTVAASACPQASAPWRELAGLHALRGAWSEAVSDARRAVARDTHDQHAWRILATALYVEGDQLGALDAWNRIGEPRIDLVNITGLDRTRFKVAARALDIAPQKVLTTDTLRRARRRLAEMPTARISRVSYRPGENGLAQVDAAIVERPLLPTSLPALAAMGLRILSDREVALSVAGPTGGGELWDVSWRWWERRERVAFGVTAPAPFGGTWRVSAADERQAYGDVASLVTERRRGGGLQLSDWIRADTRWSLAAGLDRWRPQGTAVMLGAGIEQRVRRDAITLSADAATWLGDVSTWTFRGRAAWRSSTSNEGHVLLSNGGVAFAGTDAPFALWHGAGTGQGSDILLRAHTLLHDGVIADAVFGRRLIHGSAEYRRWFQLKTRPVRFAPALFIDVARASQGARFTDTRTHVDVGAGLRVPIPGAGMVRIDVGQGLSDGRTALSVGWTR